MAFTLPGLRVCFPLQPPMLAMHSVYLKTLDTSVECDPRDTWYVGHLADALGSVLPNASLFVLLGREAALLIVGWLMIVVSLPERQWNMWIPGYGSEEIRPFKKACTTEAHKQVSACEWVSLCDGRVKGRVWYKMCFDVKLGNFFSPYWFGFQSVTRFDLLYSFFTMFTKWWIQTSSDVSNNFNRTI